MHRERTDRTTTPGGTQGRRWICQEHLAGFPGGPRGLVPRRGRGYSRPVECTDRDAPFVLDGVLYHESDLDLEEHYTDTHGYTEINFAAFVMVGMRFCPRIRSLHRQLTVP